MKMTKCPCTKDCANRNGYLCRQSCDEFISYEKKHFKELEELHKTKQINSEYGRFKKEQVRKAMKKGDKK